MGWDFSGCPVIRFLMASYIFKPSCKVNMWSARQCPLNWSAISSSLLAARIPQLRQLPGIPLSRHDGHPRHAIDIRYRTVHPYIHLTQALLHPPHSAPSFCHQGSFVAHEGPQHAHLFVRSERACQQPATVQSLNPLTVHPVGLFRPGTLANCRVSTSITSNPCLSNTSCGA